MRNSKFILILLAIILSSVTNVVARSKIVRVSTDAGANVYLNGQQVTAPVKIVVKPGSDMYLKIEKIGFITEERVYSYNQTEDKKEYIKLHKDDAYENSFVTNLANQDIDIRASRDEDESWVLLSRIITSYFDVIAITDKVTGYMCTAWSVKSFNAATIRTRLIIKTSSVDPLIYKAKLVSEIAPPGSSGSADEAFRKWDRVLRTYENVIPDLQSRLGN